MTIIDEVIQHFNGSNFYDVLKVSPDATKDEIKKAYLQRSLEWHPDKNENSSSKETSSRKFQLLTRVYQTLSDPAERVEYDKQLSQQTAGRIQDLESFARYDEVRLSECNEEAEFYYYDCRCSGQFKLSKQHLLPPSGHPSNCQNVFIVDCDSCSNTIKVSL